MINDNIMDFGGREVWKGVEGFKNCCFTAAIGPGIERITPRSLALDSYTRCE